ncbi:MAG: DJ-1/PfpI family protein [Pseudomonadota bacterium]
MTGSRRTLLKNASQIGAMAPFITLAGLMQRAEARDVSDARFGSTAEEAAAVTERAHKKLIDHPGITMFGSEEVAMVVYPSMTMLDMVGPQYFFGSMMGAKVHLVTRDPKLSPIMGDTGFAIVPTISMDDCPKDLDVLFIPGGSQGTVQAMLDDKTVSFVADRGKRSKHVTSVCTGSMLLGQAGLLHGKKATSHWSSRHLLAEFGATPVNARVVQDGNVTTGAGVSAGLDFALALLAQLRGKDYAKGVQLQAEYAPEPMFNAGTLETIDPSIGEPMHEIFARSIFAMKQAAKQRRT